MSKIAERTQELLQQGPVVFYDGECGLCDRFIQFLVRNDRRRVLRYSTLQGETAKEILSDGQGLSINWSVRLLDERGISDRSTAALRTIGHLGGGWKVALALLLVPGFIRDAVYRFVATNRYRWFGKVDACVLPTPALRERFLP